MSKDMHEQGETHFANLVTNIEKTKLPEAVFKSVFLPVFAGKHKSTDTGDILRNWVGIAGAPGKEVEIIDPKGNTVFTVPPVFNSDFIDASNRQNSRQMSVIMSTYDLHRNALPILGQNFLHNTLPNKIDSITQASPSNETNGKRWQEIFDRYFPSSAPTKEQVQPSSNVTDDDFTF